MGSGGVMVVAWELVRGGSTVEGKVEEMGEKMVEELARERDAEWVLGMG